MAVTILSKVIDEGFIKALTKVGSSSSALNKSGGVTTIGAKQEVSLSEGLRNGARSFGASIQLLNVGISYINVSRAANEKLLEIVEKLDVVVSTANKGDVTSGKAQRFKQSFHELTREFEKILKKTSEQDINVFKVDDLAGVLSRAGLERDNVDEISNAFKKITALSDSRVDTNGKVTTSADLIPEAQFNRILKQSVRDPDAVPGDDDGSGSFASVRSGIKKLRETLRSNVKALNQTTDVIGDNIELVRAVGLAMLDLSSSIAGNATAASIAETLQSKIRTSAPLLLRQAHNLEPISVAGLTLVRSRG